jgi:hypothetical protein
MATRPMERNVAPADFFTLKQLPSVQSLRLGVLAKLEILNLVCEQLYIERLPKVIEEVIKVCYYY